MGTKRKDDKYIDTATARDLVQSGLGVKVSRPAFISWIYKWKEGKPDLCHQPFGRNGRIYINERLLKEVINEKKK